MQTQEYDVVIVGAGPAGCAAAYTAAIKGYSACLIDKETFPREKLCGGLLTLRCKKVFQDIFGIEWKDDIINGVKNVTFSMNHKKLCEQNGYTDLFFTMRYRFDDYLSTLVKAKGVECLFGEGIARFDFDDNRLYLKTGLEIRYRYLVGCDGVNSLVRRELLGISVDQEKIGFGLEAEVPIAEIDCQLDRVEIDFASARWGYGWVFPKKKTVTIGVGGILKKNLELKNNMRKFLAEKGVDDQKYKIKGHHIPFGNFLKLPGRKNVLLSGDAAGYVDPITGEGIAYALLSGKIAVESIYSIDRSAADSSLLDTYLKNLRPITRSIRQANIFRWLIFPKRLQPVFSRYFSHAVILQRGFLDILSGRHEYNRLYYLFVVQALLAIKKLFSGALTRIYLASKIS